MSLLPLRRPVVSRTTYLILFACYIGIFLNLAFYRQVFPLLPVNSLHNWLVFLSMPIVAISVMNILTTLASFLKLDRLVISLFILLSASAQYFIWNFGVVIDRSMITNILDTTPAESFALLSGEMIAVLGLSGVLAVFVAWWVKIRKPATRWRGAAMRLLNIAVSALLIILVAALFYKDYASVFLQGKGFYQVVIRPGIETANAILKRIAGGEDQHRLGHFLPPHAGEKMQPVFIRQAEIQHDQAVMIAGQR